MNLLSRYLDEAYMTWLSSALSCCAPRLKDERTQMRGVEKPMTILHDQQPRLIPPPRPEPQEALPRIRAPSREWVTRTKSFVSRASRRGSFSVRRKLNAYNGPRRPRIGAPTDFRHIQNAMPRQVARFRPLELSIYMADNQLSPILPHFDVNDGVREQEDDRVTSLPSIAMTHVRSNSAMSNFSIPRKPLNSRKSYLERVDSAHTTPESVGSEFISHPLRPRPSLPESPSTQELMAALDKSLPQTPPAAHLRAHTAPVLYRHSMQVERVKSVIHEKLELEQRLKDLDNLIEARQSLYLSSRAASVYTEVEVVPLPDLSTSTLEQMPLPTRPKTAPTRVRIPSRSKSFSEASAAFSAPEERDQEPSPTTPPPPLPLVLQTTRPPLRKKKSFSRVSSWLRNEQHSRAISVDSVTNMPKPVTSRDGFYQCIDPKASTRASIRSASIDSEATGTMSTLQSTLDEIEDQVTPTVPTEWSSPGGAGVEDGEMKEMNLEIVETAPLSRMPTFGKGGHGPNLDTRVEVETNDQMTVERELQRLGYRMSSVGVAF